MKRTNGRDFGLYNTEGCIFRGSTSVISHYAIRITSFKGTLMQI